jgi:hypothetical protein
MQFALDVLYRDAVLRAANAADASKASRVVVGAWRRHRLDCPHCYRHGPTSGDFTLAAMCERGRVLWARARAQMPGAVL